MAAQINVGKLDPVSGTFTGESDVYALAGYLRGRVSTDMKSRSNMFAHDLSPRASQYRVARRPVVLA